MDTEALYFEAANQYRKSMDDLESNRLGHELARLLKAIEAAKAVYELARRNVCGEARLGRYKGV